MSTKEIIDHCPVCGEEIYFGQVAWKVGSDLCCSVDHMIQRARVVIVIAGKEIDVGGGEPDANTR